MGDLILPPVVDVEFDQRSKTRGGAKGSSTTGTIYYGTDKSAGTTLSSITLTLTTKSYVVLAGAASRNRALLGQTSVPPRIDIQRAGESKVTLTDDRGAFEVGDCGHRLVVAEEKLDAGTYTWNLVLAIAQNVNYWSFSVVSVKPA